MCGTVLQQGENAVQNFIKVSAGKFCVACAAGKRIVEIDVEMELVGAFGGRNDAEPRAKFRRIEIKLRMPACRETQGFR